MKSGKSREVISLSLITIILKALISVKCFFKLIIVPKSFSSQVRRSFWMFAIINIIIIIITDKSHARTWSWLKDDASQFYLVPFSNTSKSKWRQICRGKAFLHAFDPSCSIVFFWSFPSDHRFPHCRQQSSPMIYLWEKLWQRDRLNIIGLKEWYRQKNTDF